MKKNISRREARELLMQMIFQMDAQDDSGIDLMRKLYPSEIEKNRSQKKYIEDVFSMTAFRLNDIDEMIETDAPGWKTDRMPKADLAILRLAVCEIMYFDDIPDAVSVNEAVELTKKYGSEDAAPFINGILGSIISHKKNVKR